MTQLQVGRHSLQWKTRLSMDCPMHAWRRSIKREKRIGWICGSNASSRCDAEMQCVPSGDFDAMFRIAGLFNCQEI